MSDRTAAARMRKWRARRAFKLMVRRACRAGIDVDDLHKLVDLVGVSGDAFIGQDILTADMFERNADPGYGLPS